MTRRAKDGPTASELTAAIRAKCRDCCGGSVKEVARCAMKAECALWPFRGSSGCGEPEQPMNGQVSLFEAMDTTEAMQNGVS